MLLAISPKKGIFFSSSLFTFTVKLTTLNRQAMRKSLMIGLLAIASILFVSPNQATAQAFEKGNMVANFGAGFGWYSFGYATTSLPALGISVEKGVKDLDFGVLSVGAIAGFKHASYNWFTGYDWSWTDYVGAVRGAIHMDLLKEKKLDTYGGLAVGLRLETATTYTGFTAPYSKVTDSTINPLFAFYLGGRYYFTDKLAGFGELGYGLGYVTLGLSYKFK